MDNKSIEELEKEYVKLIKDIRLNMIADESCSDAEIKKKIAETPIMRRLYNVFWLRKVYYVRKQ